MRMTILGGKGMLGRDLATACGAAGIEAHAFDLPDVDIARESSGLERLPACDWLVNCAAYTDVDGAETHRAEAFAVNCEGARRVAQWCKARGTALLHISTDYVFDGAGNRPHREGDPARPLNVYGESKRAGEEAVRAVGGRHLVIRTQSLFGRHGRNFVAAIVAKLRKGDAPIEVVSDQRSSPTYTVHLADAILRLLACGKQGIVHVTASGDCTWYEFARAIAARVKPGAEIRPISSAQCGRPAKRPAYAVLDTSRYREWTGHAMPGWEEGLEEYLGEG